VHYYHTPDQAVLADPGMLFCLECSQKMRLIMAIPALDGRATRTYECTYGHRNGLPQPFLDAESSENQMFERRQCFHTFDIACS
jgi:hypothetical protein